MTLSEVARAAGVSLATASRAINGSATRTVHPELRERVLEAARRLAYSPDPSAQAMARGRTATLGLVVHDIADPYFAAVAAGVTEAADREGLIVTLVSTQFSPERELAFVELMHRQRARAVVLAGGRLHGGGTEAALHAALEAYRDDGGGVALVGQPLGGLPAVEVANAAGAAALATALLDLGYERLGVLAGPGWHRTAAERTAAFVATLRDAGHEPHPDDVVSCEFTRDGGATAATQLVARARSGGRPLPQLLFAVNDVMAVGAMAAAREAGLVVPGDVAIAGFDDIAMLRDVTPSLTTVRVPLHEIGMLATTLALGPAESDRPVVRGEVVLRESTSPPIPAI